MSMMQEASVATSNPFIVQVISTIREDLLKGKKWAELAYHQRENYFPIDSKENLREMKDLMNLYSSEMLDEFMEDPRCGNCGKEAMKRCSRCKNQWYCS